MTMRRALFAAAPLNTDLIVHRGIPPLPGFGWDGRPAWPLLATQPAGDGGAGGGGAAGGGAGGAAGGAQTGSAGQGSQSGSQEFVAPKDQAELDKLVGERLHRERAKYADYDELKTKAAEHDKRVEAQKTEAQKLADRAAAAEGKATETEKRALRAEIALEKGLTASQAKRLVGNTRDELVADADELLKDLGAGKGGGQQQTNFDAGQQGGSVKPKNGEGGRAAAQRRYGDKAASGASKTT